MSMRPVDFQILMPKVNELARLQNDEVYKLNGHLQQQAESSVKQADHDSETVHTQKEAQKTVITDEENNRGKNKRQDNGKGRKNNGKEASSQPDARFPKHTIDIRL